jgi:translocator protein
MDGRTFGKLCLCIGVSQAAGLLGSVFTVTSVGTWYQQLDQPAVAPPGWVFGPVWTVLYTLMGIAAFLVWERGIKRPGVKAALAAFAVQLVLNALWSVVFFGAQDIGGALLVILALWGMIILTTMLFWRVSRTAGVLMLPYFAWVTFATYLNYVFWVRN